ncbi:glutamate--tRNA ligase [Candidatus Kaiserbacteria bacterium RIFCSPHIGHO2_02_FULL_55_25]|uniref:Glutamate--tRNA ligase n=1 Tax=Candidatus Kaiserbacteria bacterium RIFCSPHIGHO2_02_FULL_55_25 TaxID=1798498 RepID=A0A1F6EAN2_9BACT|nr:MAG: glutamate--tRNA ligase [Candidatus Kaiserbacteria bacterium RIFCSPHIGHO2_01_FULL_55_79]OGG70716.1 MAG: glutamate--tRNA ligase [Candidatus Kaiserbacteria bacterium RIFCSPHIGHO2_02_FULL_55_25]OGG77169.1 MAG: glutamate--tRNA ligase [Candidatus Kaiserbacteria bacterium RIFCSPHIGHO2_12_FULL_55_13]OGG84019.1 MAG: glutamate--tRNA ligase [Candidatus Kaiserbacteria bacterium RIFCSPLOWO2_01_FULL_55_25]
MTKVVTRFPPSPTGYFHIGSARTALFNYLFAAHAGGEMRLRFEDTDKERNKDEFEQDILDGLTWLGIPYDAKAITKQSERTDVYSDCIQTLLKSGHAYEAEATTDNPDKKVIRFKNPNTRVTFTDLIRGEVSFDTTDLKDFVIAKSVDAPLYHLAVVVDDHEMGVTHVIRGEDHISNTPRQILILEALGYGRPIYAHIPLILAPDRSKLSKRHGAVSVNEYRLQGFLPEAFVNYLALLGWNPGTEQEIFTFKELIKAFTIERVHKHGAVFDLEKMLWINHEHLRTLSDDEYARRYQEFAGTDLGELPVALIKERARTFGEAAELIKNGEFQFMSQDISYEPALLIKGAKTDAPAAKQHLTAVAKLLEGLSGEQFTSEEIKNVIFPYATEEGRGAVLWPLRVALSGREKSPDPFVIASLIGKERTLQRITKAAGLL